MAETKETKEPKKAKHLEPLTGHPATQGFPPWLLEMHPQEIISLAYDDLTYSDDFFEMALITLHLRGWSYDRLHFYHHVILTPVLWPFFFKKPPSISLKLILLRWFILIAIFGGAMSGIHALSRATGTPVLFALFTGVGGLSLLLINTFIGMDYFEKWRRAYKHLTRKRLKEYLPKREKKKKAA